MDRREVAAIISNSLREILLEQVDNEYRGSVDESTCLSGAQAVIDSFNLVVLIAAIGKKLKEDNGITVIIAGESALSREESPFATVGTLADYICELMSGSPTT